MNLGWGFLGFCFLSSITYIFNDWQDREKDRLHPLKKERPLASGKVTGKTALGVALILGLLVGLTVWKLGYFYGVILLIYFILTNLYSLGLKNIPLLDIVMIAANFGLRMMAGMLNFPQTADLPYFGLLMGAIIVFLTHKRRSDIKLLGEKAIEHKPVLKYYTRRYNYVYRAVGYALFLSALYFLWKDGLALYRALGLWLQLLMTSIIFSENPEFTSKAHWLFKSKAWSALLLVNLVLFWI